MKKHILVAAALGFTVAANAQDKSYLPEAGDWGLGFDANPLISYVGNMFNGTANNSMSASWENGSNAIMGKYFLAEDAAVRGWLRLGFGSTTDRNLVYDDQPGNTNPDPDARVEDSYKASYSAIVIGGGYEIRRGGERLQGYYGPALSILLAGGSEEYTYGNAIASDNTNPTRTNFNGNDLGGGAWTTSSTMGSTFGLGLGGFIGVEYFILPKISLSAEYFWGVMMSSTGDGETSAEVWNATDNAVETSTSTTAGGSSFALDTDNNGGAIRLMFHF